MSETPAKPQNKGPESSLGWITPLLPGGSIRFSFSPLQTRAVLEAGRVQDISQKYITNLNDKILELTNQVVALRKEAAAVDAETRLLKKETDAVEKEAKNAYTDTLSLIMGELNTPEPPWDATIIMEQGLPVGVDFPKKKQLGLI